MSSLKDRQSLRVSPYAALHRLGGGNVAVWNRFNPLVVTVTEEMVAALGGGRPGAPNVDRAAFDDEELEDLIELGIVDRGVDSSRERFYTTIRSRVEALDERAAERHRSGEPYGNLYLTNTACNLSCAYCVARHADLDRPEPLRRLPRRQRLAFALGIVDSYMRHRVDAGETVTPISFNGGEILLEWEVIQGVVEHVRHHYPQMQMKYLLNTNMTLVDRERSEYMIRNGFEVHLSIDGYQEQHDRSRVYAGGRGSFDRVLANVQVFNSMEPASPINGFQGTIVDAERFDPEQVFAMVRHGFVQARLAPNLMGVGVEEGRRKADLEAELYERGLDRELEITEAYFLTVKKLMEADEYSFFFNCLGLSAYPSVGLHVNVETQELSQLCGFIPSAAIPYPELDGDIQSVRLWEAARRFIRERMDALAGTCSECDVVGICRGSCILMGLDYRNRLNPAACAYQRRLWRRCLELAGRHR